MHWFGAFAPPLLMCDGVTPVAVRSCYKNVSRGNGRAASQLVREAARSLPAVSLGRRSNAAPVRAIKARIGVTFEGDF